MSGQNGIEYKGSYSVIINLEAIGPIVLDNAFIEQAYFIEDIFNICLAGKITFFDNFGINEFGPFTGNEQVIIIFGEQEDNGFNKTVLFDVYKIENISQSVGLNPEQFPLLSFYIVDPLYKKITQNRYSKAWEEGPLKASEIWKSIFTDICEYENFGKYIEDSDDEFKNFYMPWWRPVDALNWLMKFAIGSENSVPGYLMFQNTSENESKLNYCTLEKLMQQEATDPNKYHFQTENMEYRNRILSWKKTGIDKISLRHLAGGQNIGFDFETKMRVGLNHPDPTTSGLPTYYSEASGLFTSLGNKMLYPDVTPDYNIEPNFVRYLACPTEKMLKAFGYNKWSKSYSLQQSVSIETRGFEGDGRYAGAMIEIEWPSENDEEIINKNLDGKYLVKSVIHQFGRSLPMYTQKMVLLKNGLYNPDSRSYGSRKGKSIMIKNSPDDFGMPEFELNGIFRRSYRGQ